MPKAITERTRMIVDLPSEVQLAIRLRALKGSTTTGAVVCEAVQRVFSEDLEEARTTLAEQRQSAKQAAGRQKT